jgi:membrane protein YqaA with SNARE-associated domain
LAATIFPLSSEATFLYAINNGMPLLSGVFFASVGNILAIIVNYYLGFWLYEKTKSKLESSRVGRKSIYYGHNYGFYALLLSWLPIIGDPLTLVAGLVRLRFVWFLVIAGSLRVLRYIVISYFV